MRQVFLQLGGGGFDVSRVAPGESSGCMVLKAEAGRTSSFFSQDWKEKPADWGLSLWI